jgi:putative NADH-flavin reductase
MKLTVAAATGGIGQQIVAQALAGGHDVTAVVRNPRALHAPVPAVAADLRTADPAELVDALAGADAVLSGLGPRRMSQRAVTSTGTRTLAAAAHLAGVRRLIVVSAAPLTPIASRSLPHPPRHDPGDGFFMRHALSPLVRRILREHYADLVEMEDMLRESGLDWTSVRPPRLTNGPRTGRYRTAYDRNIRGGLTVSRADVADLMLRLVTEAASIGHTVGVAR